MAQPQERLIESEEPVPRWWQLWWERFLSVLPIVTVLLLGGLIGVVIAGYWFALPWTGLTAYTDPTGDYHPDKTLWDWLSLLFVPVVIGVATYVFRRTEQNIERQRAEERAKIEKDAANRRAETERALALDAQRETAFQTYLD